MKEITFDFNNLFSEAIGSEHGVTEAEVKEFALAALKAQEHLTGLIAKPSSRIRLGLEWAQLPFQDKLAVSNIQRLGQKIAKGFDNVISLGIGGSYLGVKAAQDALCPAYYNEFDRIRKKRPKIYFEGNNLDPDTLSVLLKELDPKKTFVVVISKSGETIETKAAFMLVEHWLKKAVGSKYGRQVLAITDPESGSLRKKVGLHQNKDARSFRSLALLKGVGGRFSEFNMGLLHLAIIGVDIQEALLGCRAMAKKCMIADFTRNPASLYALLHTVLYKKKGKPIAVMMPFSEKLKSTADWYVQLLAESLGKKFARKIQRAPDGTEIWLRDEGCLVNVGRTPISARGTNDLHSIQQNNIEGQNDKVVTFIRVDSFARDIKIPGSHDILAGKRYSQLLKLAQEATEWALVRQSRPNCTITLPEISAYYWGALLFFFEMATAFEGELLNVNAFDQPGVEGYKNYMYYKLGKAGLSEEVRSEIEENPLRKNPKFII